jgi:mannose-1-phosphate guanylyltransferase / mannose-6-phosphate isomerase
VTAQPRDGIAATALDIQPVVMAGGSGTRLWPLSRADFPKQFLAVAGGPQTLYQDALLRVMALADDGHRVAPPITVTNEEHRFLALDQLRDLHVPVGVLLLEPMGRNTAPALTLAALQAMAQGRDPVLVVTPADQTVTDRAAATIAMRRAARAAQGGAIVVLGITPDRPETGYGYIKSEAATGDAPAKVLRFEEKPALDVAKRYLAEGGYTWNGGIFVLKASRWLASLEAFRPDIAQATRAAFDARTHDDAFVRPDKTLFARVPDRSVDYAVMERCPGSDFDLRMVSLNADWNDLGAWDAVWQVAGKDAQGNATHGDVILSESRGCLVHAQGRLVGVAGLDDVVVVETVDAVLVTRRDKAQDVKTIVAALTAQQRSEKSLHRKVHRPWGWYDSIDSGPRFQVKRIVVKPGAALSLQMHHHRAEHWVVVSGTAEVTNGDQVMMLSENQSTYIPIGRTHRLRNPGKVPLELIEVQSGSYLGEDDIVRFEDTYGRS